MFERYTEQARRVVFFARYEASVFGSPSIEAEHILLGMLREGNLLKNRLSAAAIDDIRHEIERRSPERERISTSADLPVSDELKRVFVHATDEATALGQRSVDVGHLVLGLLEVKESTVKDLLARHGIVYDEFREVVRSSPPTPTPEVPGGGMGSHVVSFEPARPATFEPEQLNAEAAAPSLREAIIRLDDLIQRMAYYAETQTEAYGHKRLKRKPWTRMQAIGHLVDWSTTHHGWFARAMTEPVLTAPVYPADEWVAAQKYQDFGWPEIVRLWNGVNRLLIHVLTQIPEEKVNTPCRIGVSDPVPLAKLASNYVDHVDEMVGQVLAHL